MGCSGLDRTGRGGAEGTEFVTDNVMGKFEHTADNGYMVMMGGVVGNEMEVSAIRYPVTCPVKYNSWLNI